jgi:HEAT repeat protein
VAALWAVGRVKIKEASVGVIQALGDRDSTVKELAAWAAGRLELREAAPGLVKALGDPTEGVRTAAAWAAGHLRLKEAVPPLVNLIRNPKSTDVETALWALGQLRAAEAIPFLLAASEQKARRGRSTELRPGAILALRAFPAADVLPKVLEALNGPNRSLRPLAAEALRAIHSPDSTPVLLKLLEDPSEDVQGPAASALGELGVRDAIPRLLAILQDENSDARGNAAYALSLLRAEEAIPVLRRAVQDPDRSVEGEFVRALERFGDDESRDFVIAGLANYRDEGIYAAAMWLCREGRKAAVQPLIDEAEVFLPLNGLRRPDEWKKLCAKRLEGDLEGTSLEILEKIASVAGLAVSLEYERLDPNLETFLVRYQIPNPTGQLTAAEALLALVRHLDGDYEAILDPGRLRLVPFNEAEDFWTRWSAEALKKK